MNAASLSEPAILSADAQGQVAQDCIEDGILPSSDPVWALCLRQQILLLRKAFATMVQHSLDKLQAAFREALPLPEDVNYSQIIYGQTKGWDSIAHMTLIAAIETQFDVMLNTEELIALSSFSKAQELLQQHGVTFE